MRPIGEFCSIFCLFNVWSLSGMLTYLRTIHSIPIVGTEGPPCYELQSIELNFLAEKGKRGSILILTNAYEFDYKSAWAYNLFSKWAFIDVYAFESFSKPMNRLLRTVVSVMIRLTWFRFDSTSSFFLGEWLVICKLQMALHMRSKNTLELWILVASLG